MPSNGLIAAETSMTRGDAKFLRLSMATDICPFGQLCDLSRNRIYA